MTEQRESLSSFVDKSKKCTEYDKILGRNVLVAPSEEQYELLLKRLKQQLGEGRGEVILEIGASEDGSENGLLQDEVEAAVATLQSLANTLECSCVKLRERKETRGVVVQYLIRRVLDQSDFLEIRVAVVGNVDAGKSTLLGVLTHGELDNGRGTARQKLFRHKHEMESGRTSSVGNDILGFDEEGNVVNKPDHGSLDWVKICERSSKVITFIDLAGHERYLKTTVFGMTGHAPDFGMLMVGANAGIIGMTKEHLGLALALSVPVFVVVTKIDMCPVNVLQDNLKMLIRILKSPGCRKVPVMVKTPDDVVLSATNFVSERLCPIFQVSNVTGENLTLLKTFLNLLTTKMEYHENEPAEFQIDDTYSVPGVGTVVSGTTLKGIIRLNDTLMLGPDALGHFVPIAVKSIHRKRMAVKEVRAGQTASFALKKIKRSQIRKGMVMVSPTLNPQACWEFEGEILVLHHPTTISSRYQAMVHCGSIRQTASIISMSKECLRTGDKALIHFRFIKHPEYMTPGQRMVFREGRTKAVGNVVRIILQASPTHQGNKAKQNKQQRYGQGHQKNQQDKTRRDEVTVTVLEKENYLKEFSEIDAMNMENAFQGSSDKRETDTQKPGTKKGRSRRGGRGKSLNASTKSEITNITPVHLSNRTTARVQ
ncbi:GTP-binding protein 1 [Cylas formicarius]|uniref:GTP-binding protein 1 n=1 Tax=Cylas formicarius TaxID=197179 RepID=UPI002958BEE0|nr:GTP-binding protein 1 [Cylas formicarius]XP_060527780.1 GTP-binding protein 1 [Cylas formicarius]XP_060527782.1 GTP-binding protein 1 [Cylas formicarius]XP_060527783.1 GTP-binding protein 1 [Cylas formicarius]